MSDNQLLKKYPYAFLNSESIAYMDLDEKQLEEYCFSEELPAGWVDLFWMCIEELYEPLKKADMLHTFHFLQVKEKYGEMCLYSSGATAEVNDIISKYEYLSQFVCENCGKPAEVQTCGWIENLCKDCFEKSNPNSRAEKIKLDLHPVTIRFSPGHREEIPHDYTETWNAYLKRYERKKNVKGYR